MWGKASSGLGRALKAALVLAAAGCGEGGDSPAGPRGDAGAEVSPAGRVELAATRDAALAASLGLHAAGWARADQGWRGATAGQPRALGVAVAEATSGGLRLTTGGAGLELQVQGARDAAWTERGTALEARDVLPGTHATLHRGVYGVELLTVLEDDAAPTELRLAARREGLGAPRPEPGGHLLFPGPDGRGVLRVVQPFAVDAAGQRREAALAWEGEAVVVRLDTRGLSFPVVLDPVVEVAVWQQVAHPGGRSLAASAYDAARGALVLFGGAYPSGVAGDTWEWDGTAWKLVATGGPPPRAEAGLAYDVDRGVTVLFGGRDGATRFSDTWEWDGNGWTERPVAGPPARRGHAMAWDAVRKEAVVFGGQSSTDAYLSDTWVFDGTAWVERAVAGPSARARAALAWDGARGGVYLLGGSSGAGYLADLWRWDGAAWSVVAGPGPSARQSPSLAFDAARSALVVFGGDRGGTLVLGDTWAWDGTGWTQVSSAGPAARTRAAAGFHALAGELVVHGGDTPAQLSDTWTWDGTTWTRADHGVPEARSGHGVAYDSTRGLTIVHGGRSLASTTLADTWAWDGARWRQEVSGAPREDFGMTFDTARQVVVAHAGYTVGVGGRNDTVTYDGTAWSTVSLAGAPGWGWALAFDAARGEAVLNPEPTLTSFWDGTAWSQRLVPGPTARGGVGHGFDSTRSRVVLFGGLNPGVAFLDDLWEWDGTLWEERSPPAPRPGARARAYFAHDPARRTNILFGGGTTSYPSDTTWEWDGTTWRPIATAVGPSPRWSVLAFDAARGVGVIHSGAGAATPDDDTWEYHMRGGDCAVGSTCDLGYCVDATCCDQAACPGVCSSCATPARPGTCASVRSADDADTCTGTRTCDAAGACRLKDGQACGSAGECASDHCVDGVCCATACAGACQVCNGGALGLGTPDGTCGPAADGDPGTPSCAPLLCDGALGVCPPTCLGDADCVAGTFCASNGTCQAVKAQADACNPTECRQPGCRLCDGLTCEDGFCCATPCAGTCRTCGATPLGVCTVVASRADPDTCTGASACSPIGECRLTLGQACASDSACLSGFCVDGVCCDTACAGSCDGCSAAAGRCTSGPAGASGSPSCAPYLCGGAADCPTACSSDAGCVASSYCSAAGVCEPRKAQGAACDLAGGVDCRVAGCRACASGHCVDGVCCDGACSQSCDACSSAAGSTAGEGVCAVSALGTPGAGCAPYACDGTSAGCATTCSSDAACAPGAYCGADQTCKPRKAQGAVCNTSAGADCATGGCRACQSGHCVDLVCCDSACAGACDTCGTAGVCELAAAGDAGKPTCAPYLCDGATASCPAACTTDTQCAGDAWCDPAQGRCVADLPQGVACTAPGHCASDHCVDGVCCDAACTGLCQACTQAAKGFGADGTCGNVASGRDPRDDCPDEGAAGCQRDGTCGGGGACRLYAAGVSCGATSCAGNLVRGQICSGTGSCVAEAGGIDCAPYRCSGAACANPCSGDGDCLSGNFCDQGTCRALLAVGFACAAGSQCQSGHCVDGVCCDSACAGTCSACTAALKGRGADGACEAIAPGTDPGDECADQGAASCGEDGSCNGSGACARYAVGTSCGAPLCSGSTLRRPVCSSAGSCAPDPAADVDCAPFVCVAGACVTTCATDVDCAGGQFCDALGACRAPLGVGAACTGASQCQSGHCVDGVCCDSACAGTCSACTAALKGRGADGACEAIAPGNDPDDECADQGAASCGENGVCNGSGGCARYAPGVSCGGAVCSGDTLRQPVCSAAGNCGPDPATDLDCAPYACAQGGCLASCADDGDCAGEAFCDGGGECRPRLSNGQACGAAPECDSGFCRDGVCCNEACAGQCQACDSPGSEGVCVAVAGAPHGARAACAGSGGQVCAGTCDGINTAVCTYPSASVGCGSVCAAGQLTPSECDGQGACVERPTDDCPGNLLCADATACLSECADNAQCAAGYQCTPAGDCTPAGTTCDGDHTLTNPDGTQQDCSPIKCAGSACLERCSTSLDCVATYSCDPASGACVPARGAARAADEGGCGCVLPGRAAPVRGAGVLGLLMLVAARARAPRRARRPSRPG